MSKGKPVDGCCRQCGGSYASGHSCGPTHAIIAVHSRRLIEEAFEGTGDKSKES